jgi:tripartite-type tricarboxylate transporter receptor subunit TctC
MKLRIIASVALLAASATGAFAQANTTRIIIPFAPGGGQDVLARIISTELGQLLGDTIIIENRPGAGGMTGAGVVARSAPDGKTMVMAASSHTISAAINKNPPFDPVKDFTAVAHVGTGAMMVLLNSKLPAKTVMEFVEYAKANPGKLNYASAGVGSATHMAMAYFASRAGISVVHVPFKSTAEALNAVATNTTQALIVPTLGSQTYVNNPDVRILAVMSKNRIPSLPDTPSVSESGLPGVEFSSWFGLLGPAKMPAGITATINSAVAKVIAMPAVSEKIEQQGIEPKSMSTADFTQLLTNHFESTKAIVKSAGIAAE